jgi:hypothetical protein
VEHEDVRADSAHDLEREHDPEQRTGSLRESGRAGSPAAARSSVPGGASARIGARAIGRTNKEIGQLLGMSPRTAQRHVMNVYDKLGLESRAGLALYAVERDLLASGFGTLNEAPPK